MKKVAVFLVVLLMLGLDYTGIYYAYPYAIHHVSDPVLNFLVRVLIECVAVLWVCPVTSSLFIYLTPYGRSFNLNLRQEQEREKIARKIYLYTAASLIVIITCLVFPWTWHNLAYSTKTFMASFNENTETIQYRFLPITIIGSSEMMKTYVSLVCSGMLSVALFARGYVKFKKKQ